MRGAVEVERRHCIGTLTPSEIPYVWGKDLEYS